MYNAVRRLARTLAVVLTGTAAAQSPASPVMLRPPSQALISQQELLDRMTRLGDSLALADAFAGVILVAKDGQPLLKRAYGMADRGRRIKNEVTTTFNISSLGKLFTQVAIGQLAASGRLAVDSLLARAWPDYPNADVARQVTLRQLLDHRSGIGGDIFQHPTTLRRNSDYIRNFAQLPLQFAPGSKNEYSNAGYVVLGEVVGRAAGEDYYRYVEQNIFNRAAMGRTGFFASDSLPVGAAIGYTRYTRTEDEGAAAGVPLHRNEAIQPKRGSAAGGSYSNVDDLLRFIIARREGKLGAVGDTRLSVVAGGSAGSNGMIAEQVSGGYDIIVLANMDPPAAGDIVMHAISWLGGPPGGMRRIFAPSPAGESPNSPIALPDSPVGRVAAAYLKAFNTGADEQMRKFFETSAVDNPARPIADRVATFRSMYAEKGRLKVVSVDAADPTTLTFTVSDSHGETTSMILTVQPQAPNRLVSLQYSMMQRRSP